ncbi:hypothetical protein [Marinimicrobium sp. ABcell2]|uniref:ApeI family dehydratase n=1 Tax=Marinimicrobium sp. ABcell2 TaxID=3069751 RepID=UPI0027ADE806|nr:hypothetical protein [Marinimicrobium sp. ABcell2]
MIFPPYEILEQTDEHLVVTLKLEPDMPCFAGHFDNLPVLAGVVQVGWALDLAQKHFNKTLQFRGFRSVKFQQLVRPPVQLTLTLDWLADRQLLKFSYHNQRGRCSTGGIGVAEGG